MIARAGPTTPTGIVRFDRAATIGDLFSVWGMPLGRRRLLSFHGAVSLFRNGIRVRGDPRSVPLRDGDELVLETGIAHAELTAALRLCGPRNMVGTGQ